MGWWNLFVWHYLLLDDAQGAIALDCGIIGACRRIKRFFAQTNRQPSDLKAILLTHGHLDHASEAQLLSEWSGAPIYLSPLDSAITRGEFAYDGINRWCGRLERVGRTLTRYRAPQSITPLEPGMILPGWGGLEVISLPGHTPGHVGFYSREKRVLFIGDSILSRGPRVLFPLPFFNVDGNQLRESLLPVLDLPIDVIYPMHHHRLDGSLVPGLRARLESWQARQSQNRPAM